jgi:anti-sigma factor RsiW
MRCSSCSRLLDRYIDGTLRPRQMLDVTEHLRDCAACSELLHETKVVDGLLFTTEPAALPQNFTFAVMAEVNSMPAPRPCSHPVWSFIAVYPVAAWVAGVAAMAVTGTSPGEVLAFLSAAFSHAGAVNSAVWTAYGHRFNDAPALALFGFGTLLLDAVLGAAIAGFYLFLRPRLAATLASVPEVRS